MVAYFFGDRRFVVRLRLYGDHGRVVGSFGALRAARVDGSFFRLSPRREKLATKAILWPTR